MKNRTLQILKLNFRLQSRGQDLRIGQIGQLIDIPQVMVKF